MKNYRVILVALVLFYLALAAISFSEEISWEDIGGGNINLRTVSVHPQNQSIIYIGLDTGLFRTDDGGGNWKNILSLRGQKRAVNFLFFDTKENNSLYVATANGLFYASYEGQHAKRIYQGKNAWENECTALAVLPSAIYLGTKGGLFVSKDKGRSWHRERTQLGNSHILAIAYNAKEPGYIYVACIDGVFKTQDSGQSWGRIFIAKPTENGTDTDAEEENEDRDEEIKFSRIRFISIDPNNPSRLYLGTSRGVYKSQDMGGAWELMPDYGLLNREIKFLLISSQSKIYAVTKSGIFTYNNNRWEELSLRLTAGEVRSLTLDNQDNLYAACEKGFFRMKKEYFSKDSKDSTIVMYYKEEPKIAEVQQAAIKYAEVESEKIKEWRKKAKMKAILPKLTVGLDRSESSNYEIYTSATTHYIYEGPDDKSNGWDVTLSWELGDLIWNDDQTSIDVRSRLMVELRDDILDEVTKLYFERIRVKMELDNLSIEERKKRFEKELRLQELTASLDALTGGYFSQQLTKGIRNLG
jgi:hypothetical protein